MYHGDPTDYAKPCPGVGFAARRAGILGTKVNKDLAAFPW
jgi:hypothetical protein